MPTENLRDFYIKAGVLPPAAVWERTGGVTPVGEAARAKLYAIDPDFAVSENMLPRGEVPAPTQTPNPEARKAIWDRAFEADPDEAANAYLAIGKAPTEKGNLDLSNRPQVKNADGSISTVKSMSINEDGKEVLIPMVREDGKMMDEKEAISHYHKTGKHLGKFNSVEEANAAAERIHQSEAKKLSSNKSGKAVPSSEAEAAGGKTFDTLLQDAMSGNKNAIAFVNDIGRIYGFDNLQVTKDGIQYQEDGEWKTATPEEMRPMYDQAVKGLQYFKQYAAGQSKSAAPTKAQQPRQAIPTNLDPAVLRSLRAKAILQGDVGDLVAYSRMPGQIDETAASAAYRRAATQRALRDAQQQAQPQIEYEYLEDGTTLLVDKNTKRRVGLLDQDDQPMPLSYINNQAQYHKDMDAIIKDVAEDKGQVIRNGTMNPIIKLPNGLSMTYSQYKLAKEGGFKKGHGNVGTASTGGK